jgi:hypothetical protein
MSASRSHRERGHAPAGRADTTVMGPLAQAPIRSQARTGDVHERVTGPADGSGSRHQGPSAVESDQPGDPLRYILTVCRRPTRQGRRLSPSVKGRRSRSRSDAAGALGRGGGSVLARPGQMAGGMGLAAPQLSPIPEPEVPAGGTFPTKPTHDGAKKARLQTASAGRAALRPDRCRRELRRGRTTAVRQNTGRDTLRTA